MKKIALILAVALAFPGSAMAAGLTVVHSQGETVITDVPQSVMVTDWAAFDNLTALGIPVSGIPGGVVPEHLSAKVSDDMVRIGSLQEPDVERIAGENPDLLIVGARSRTFYPVLSALIPTLDSSADNSEIIDSLKAQLTSYGQIFRREAQAEELIANLDAKIAEARAAAVGRGTGLVIVTNAGRIGVYGPESRVSWIYKALGVPSVFDDIDDRDHGGDAISFEYLLQADPDWLFVVDRDAGVGNVGAARGVLDNELVHQTRFWKNEQIVYLDPAASYMTMNGYDAIMLLLDQVIAGYSDD